MDIGNEIIIAAITGLFGGSLISGIAKVIEAKSGAKSSTVDEALRIVEELRTEIERLKKRISALEDSKSWWEKYSQHLLAGIKCLIRQVLELGDNKVRPAFDPESFEDFV